MHGRVFGDATRQETRNQEGKQTIASQCAKRLFEAGLATSGGSHGHIENIQRDRHGACFFDKSASFEQDPSRDAPATQTRWNNLGVVAKEIGQRTHRHYRRHNPGGGVPSGSCRYQSLRRRRNLVWVEARHQERAAENRRANNTFHRTRKNDAPVKASDII